MSSPLFFIFFFNFLSILFQCISKINTESFPGCIPFNIHSQTGMVFKFVCSVYLIHEKKCLPDININTQAQSTTLQRQHMGIYSFTSLLRASRRCHFRNVPWCHLWMLRTLPCLGATAECFLFYISQHLKEIVSSLSMKDAKKQWIERPVWYQSRLTDYDSTGDIYFLPAASAEATVRQRRRS